MPPNGLLRPLRSLLAMLAGPQLRGRLPHWPDCCPRGLPAGVSCRVLPPSAADNPRKEICSGQARTEIKRSHDSFSPVTDTFRQRDISRTGNSSRQCLVTACSRVIPWQRRSPLLAPRFFLALVSSHLSGIISSLRGVSLPPKGALSEHFATRFQRVSRLPRVPNSRDTWVQRTPARMVGLTIFCLNTTRNAFRFDKSTRYGLDQPFLWCECSRRRTLSAQASASDRCQQ